VSLVALERVSKSYRRGGAFASLGRVQVLDRIDLEIGEGECLGLLGVSGSGKSTLGRLVLGLEAPDAGTVSFRGTALADLAGGTAHAARRALQVVFQDSLGAVNPRHSVRRILAEPLVNFDRMRGHDLDRRISELLLNVGLDPADAGKLPGQMSGGQLQRVCIARALAPRPALIVLDEAVSNIDLTLQMKVLDLLAGLRRRLGTSYLFITHDIRLARRFCEHIAVLHDGRIVDQIRTAGSDTFSHPAGQALADAVLPSLPSTCRHPS